MLTLYSARACAGAMTLFSLLLALQIPSYLGIALYKEQFLAVAAGLTLTTVFLLTRAGRSKDGRVPWYDWIIALIAPAVLFSIAIWYAYFLREQPFGPPEMLAMGSIIVILVMEALRRTAGLFLFFIVLGFIVYAMVGHLVPAPLTGRSIAIEELPIYLGFDPSALLGAALSVSVTIVILFIFLGQLLFKTGGGEFFTDLAMATMGRRRGGAAKISVVASAMFGSISGSAVSNVATTGVITIPLMQRSGYSGVQAGAIEAIASTGGQFMPPIMGAAAFLMAEFLELPYTDVIVAGLIPALLYYFAVFVQVDLVAARDDITAAAESLPKVRTVLKEGWHFIVPFAVLIFALFELNTEPEIAALYAAATIAVGGALRPYKGKRLRLREFFATFWDTGIAMVELNIIVAAAGFVIGILNLSGGGFALTLFLIELGGDQLAVLLLIAAGICILLGMGMPTTGVYVLLAALVAPSLVEAGVLPLAAHVFILYFGMMSMITPPIALAAFAAATLSRESPTRTGFMAMKLGWVAYVVPFLFVLSPTLIMQGEAEQIAINVATATVGVYLVAVAVEGYFARPLDVARRLALGVVGLVAMMPDTALGLEGAVAIAGSAIGLTILGHEHFAFRRARLRNAPPDVAGE